ncbi:MAG: hypothetical protein ABJO29_05555 [Yoonia sp.]|uniref:hypothetical protein n=1 Tax=Yoonia sp. TaxID=2212373 RepID=UPI003285E2F1
MTKREEFGQAALDMHSEGLLKFTDECIKANEYALIGRASKLADNLNASKKQELTKAEDLSECPSPRTLRRWIAAMNKFGRGGLVDRIDGRGNRSSRMGPEAIGLMMKEVRGYLSLEKPSIKHDHENVRLSFHERNEQAKLASGLNLQNWSEERMAKVESNLLACIEFFERKEPAQQKAELGHHIPSFEEQTGVPLDHRAPKKSRGAKAGDLPAKPSSFTVEED